MTSPHHPLTVGSTFGPYRLDRLIGRGGMGEVYQAYDTVKDRTVAIKVLPERLAQDPVYRQRFQRESRTAARLREAHVIPIHDYGEIDGRLFIDMRLVDGESLRELLDSRGPGAPDRTVTLIEQVAAALDAAHADGLLHRDVKPDNILLSRDGFAYLVDFGIAQSSTDTSLTSDGSAVGSYRYMAPERFSSRDFGPASDVYGLACVLYESLTGSRPFTADTDGQIMRAHLFDPPPRPSLVRTMLPAAFDAVIARGMAKNPNERYRSAGELAAAARAALTGRQDDATVATSATNSARAQPNPDSDTTVSTVVPTHSTGGPAGPPTGPTGPAGSAAPPRRGRLRRVAALLTALVMVAAAVAFAGWAKFVGSRTDGVAVAGADALGPAEVELLSVVGALGYGRSNCYRDTGDPSVVALFACTPNPAASAPTARFFRFRSADALSTYYKAVVLEGLDGAACTGDPAGSDGPSIVDGKTVGRKSCVENKVETPAAPKPTLVLTNDAALAMVLYIWADPSEKPLRDYRAKINGGQFRTAENAQDPDEKTVADRELLAHTGDDFRQGNCRHVDPPGSSVTAALDCATALGKPAVSWMSFAERRLANTLYQGNLSQFNGRGCGGGAGSDAVWRKTSGVAGRYFCFDSTVSGSTAVVCLMAVHDEFMLVLITCTAPSDSPEGGPKTEAELNTYFLKDFG
ncbi:serine/threonine protein kinase [Nocardia sp. 2]|uniref:non-specific serine/threonine protein kinase n=1 Tax=Nocardia acididurans TaxID=2802282 RepID=A0ABS1MEY3_9NOCA|nr:serine/threonine-protein kinase [Nocardia acididurans]MBL1078655.1 serine/threonine protein kinase [Nocardia acididurans]